VYFYTAHTVTSVHFSDVQHVLATSRDPKTLLKTWGDYQRRFSPKINEYLEILQLAKVACDANGENEGGHYASATSYLFK
jgi:hypothetical protein